MNIKDILASLELACQYCLEYPDRQTHYDALSDLIYSIIKCGPENEVGQRFIEQQPVFRQACSLLSSHLFSVPAAQHGDNVVYLTDRLQQQSQQRDNVVYLTDRLPSF